MSGLRIRTVKPEWLEDEDILRAGSDARVLSVALILLADDYGRGRCIPEALAHQVFPFDQEPSRVFRESLARLSAMHFVRLYEVRGQRYFEIRNWTKHQRVDKPGKPRVPPPESNDSYVLEDSGDGRATPANDSGESREGLAPDLDLDLDLEGEGSAREPSREGGVNGSSGRAGSHALISAGGSTGRTYASAEGDPELDEDGEPIDAMPPPRPQWQLWAVWEELAGGGSDTCGPRLPHERNLLTAWGSCAKRSPRDPVGLWRGMVEAFVADQRASGRALRLDWLMRDFAGLADRVSRATTTEHEIPAQLRPVPLKELIERTRKEVR